MVCTFVSARAAHNANRQPHTKRKRLEVCLCLFLWGGGGGRTLRSCSNCKVHNSYVLQLFHSETMSFQFDHLVGKLLGTRTLIHSFLIRAAYA